MTVFKPATMIERTHPYTIKEAATYTRFSVSGLRTCIQKGELVPDARGPHRIALFKRETLDRFLENRAKPVPRPKNLPPTRRGQVPTWRPGSIRAVLEELDQ